MDRVCAPFQCTIKFKALRDPNTTIKRVIIAHDYYNEKQFTTLLLFRL